MTNIFRLSTLGIFASTGKFTDYSHTNLRRPTRAALGLILLSTALAGCGGSDSNNTDNGDNNPQGVLSPTYHEHIASILNDNCVTCHQAGGIAPFVLDDYAAVLDVNALNDHIGPVTANRSMPPYLADNSGQCNTFKDARWLSNDDIATIGNWVEQGMPEGTAPSTPLQPPAQLSLQASEVNATAMMDTSYSPSGNPPDNTYDDYRCFVVDPGISTDQFLTAYEVKPGNSELVHHIILYALQTDAAEAEATRLDAIDPTPGYTCYGGSGILGDNPTDVGFLAGWAPGINVTRYPANTGIPLLANRKMVMQIHYNLDGGRTGSDQTAIDLALSSTVTQPATVFAIADLAMQLQPGLANTSTNITIGPIGLNKQIHGVFPHMHTLGRKIKVERVRPTNSRDCIADIPNWNFEWQQFFFFSEESGPMTVNATDKLSLTCTYDTRSRTSVVTWGDGTQDEMCINFFYTTDTP